MTTIMNDDNVTTGIISDGIQTTTEGRETARQLEVAPEGDPPKKSSDITPHTANDEPNNNSLVGTSELSLKRHQEEIIVDDINLNNNDGVIAGNTKEEGIDNPKASLELEDIKAAARAAALAPSKPKTKKRTAAKAKKKPPINAKAKQAVYDIDFDLDDDNDDDADDLSDDATPKGKRPRKAPQRRDLPPVLKSQYDALDAIYEKMNLQHANVQQAQRALQQAEQRLRHAETALQASTQTQNVLEEQVLEMELSLDNEFTKHYNLLLRFRAEHGHVHVPHSHPLLGKWVRQQKRNRGLWIKKQQRGKSVGGHKPWKLYFKALDRLGFVWDSLKDQWQSQFDKLLIYQHEHGHTCVPKSYAADKPLGAWTHRQRYFYKLYHEGKPTQLTRERIDLLNSIGFSWSGDHRTPVTATRQPQPTKSRSGHKRTPSQDWEYHFDMLCDHKDQHGHTRISALGDQLRNNQLRDWVAWQRKQYKHYQANQPSILIPDRIQRMEAIGFEWVPNLKDIPRRRTGKNSNGSESNDSNNFHNDYNMELALEGMTTTTVDIGAAGAGQMEINNGNNSNRNEALATTNARGDVRPGTNDPYLQLRRHSTVANSNSSQYINGYNESAAAAAVTLADSIMGAQQLGFSFPQHPPPTQAESAEAAAVMMAAYNNGRHPNMQFPQQSQQHLQQAEHQHQLQQQQHQQQHFTYNM